MASNSRHELPKAGLSEESILNSLNKYKETDADWRTGKVFGYVFHVDEAAERVIEKAHNQFMWDNALDPRVFQSLLRMEKEVVQMVSQHLQGDEEVVGNMTSGGTESILLAVKSARDFALAKGKDPAKLNMILPITAHAAFHKACEYFCVKAQTVDIDPDTLTPDPKDYEKLINKNTFFMMGSAPSYAHGVIDPIEELSELAFKHDIKFHVDACVGGWLLPFFRKAGKNVPPFDFSLRGVTSISVDLHKYAFAAKGASVLLHRSKETRMHQIFTCTSWTGYAMINPTMLSTKSGGPIAGAWAALHHFGEEGYLKVAKGLVESTDKLINGINSIDGLSVMGTPGMSLLAFSSKKLNLFRITDELTIRGWDVQPQHHRGSAKPSIHLTVMPTSAPQVDAFIKDLTEVSALVSKEKSLLKKVAMKSILSVVPKDLSYKNIEMVLKKFGVGEGNLPDGGMSDINMALNEIDPKKADKLFKVYANELYR